jgi:hypothetical protein
MKKSRLIVSQAKLKEVYHIRLRVSAAHGYVSTVLKSEIIESQQDRTPINLASDFGTRSSNTTLPPFKAESIVRQCISLNP